MTMEKNSDWSIERGSSAILATAVHNGNNVRPELKEIMQLSAADQLREEDPFTGKWTVISDNKIILHTSRFEVDLNRPPEKAMYRRPEDAWGLHIWETEPSDDMVARSLEKYDNFYATVREILDDLEKKHGSFVVYDIHSYNHRRNGPDAPAEDESANPEVNLGTGSMDKSLWGAVAEAFMSSMASFDFGGRKLDVRENVKFKGGWLSQWVHREYPKTGCCLAIEFKKFFMDEWTGTPFDDQIALVEQALRSSTTPVLNAIKQIPTK